MKRSCLLTTVYCLMAAAYCPAGEPAITVPETVPEHTLVKAYAQVEDGKVFIWVVHGPRGWEDTEQIAANYTAMTFVGPPGGYSLRLFVVREDFSKVEMRAEVTITKGPEPQPDPDPIPPPPPPGDTAVVIVIEAQDTMTQAQETTRAGLEAYLVRHQIWWRTADRHKIDGKTKKTPTYLVPCLKAIEDKDLEVPVLVVGVMSKDGVLSVVAAEELPTTIEKAIEFVRKKR